MVFLTETKSRDPLLQRVAEQLMRKGRQGPGSMSLLDKSYGLGSSQSRQTCMFHMDCWGLLAKCLYLRAAGGQGHTCHSLCTLQRCLMDK